MGSILLLLLIILLALYTGCLRFNYPSKTEYPIRGIDISRHQNNIQWYLIDTTEVHFVYIKATEGSDFIDRKFSYNWKKAWERNIPVGAYHFFTFCKSGNDQANNFINTVPKLSEILPPVIDLEYGGNCKTSRLSKNEILKEIKIFEEKIHNYYGKKPILYVTQEFYEDFLMDKFHDNPLWYRNIYRSPKIKGDRNWLFWQYSNRGHMNGINTYVDLNVFHGNKKDFKRLLN
ncbi:lysozyme [Apibacter muscae]|nr:lysozyme [Apibacter muscae]